MSVTNSAAGPSSTQDLSGVCILVLDDDPNMRSLIRGALARCRCQNILVSGDAREALRLFSHRTIDLVISDWMMEPMSGREFLRELRRPERKVDVPVIMLSASSEPNDIAFAQQFRISGWLTKPIALPELLRQISTVLTLSANCAPLDTGFELDAGRLAERYRSKITDDLRILDEALLAMQNIKEIDSSSWAAAAQRGTTWALVDRVMHNIKGQAGSFNLDLITFIAALGQELTRPMANSNFLVRNHHDAVHPAVVALVEAMRIVLQNGIRGDGGQIGERLLEKLRGHTRPIRAGLESDAEGRAGPPRTSRPPVSS